MTLSRWRPDRAPRTNAKTSSRPKNISAPLTGLPAMYGFRMSLTTLPGRAGDLREHALEERGRRDQRLRPADPVHHQVAVLRADLREDLSCLLLSIARQAAHQRLVAAQPPFEPLLVFQGRADLAQDPVVERRIEQRPTVPIRDNQPALLQSREHLLGTVVQALQAIDRVRAVGPLTAPLQQGERREQDLLAIRRRAPVGVEVRRGLGAEALGHDTAQRV